MIKKYPYRTLWCAGVDPTPHAGFEMINLVVSNSAEAFPVLIGRPTSSYVLPERADIVGDRHAPPYKAFHDYQVAATAGTPTQEIIDARDAYCLYIVSGPEGVSLRTRNFFTRTPSYVNQGTGLTIDSLITNGLPQFMMAPSGETAGIALAPGDALPFASYLVQMHDRYNWFPPSGKAPYTFYGFCVPPATNNNARFGYAVIDNQSHRANPATSVYAMHCAMRRYCASSTHQKLLARCMKQYGPGQLQITYDHKDGAAAYVDGYGWAEYPQSSRVAAGRWGFNNLQGPVITKVEYVPFKTSDSLLGVSTALISKKGGVYTYHQMDSVFAERGTPFMGNAEYAGLNRAVWVAPFSSELDSLPTIAGSSSAAWLVTALQGTLLTSVQLQGMMGDTTKYAVYSTPYFLLCDPFSSSGIALEGLTPGAVVGSKTGVSTAPIIPDLSLAMSLGYVVSHLGDVAVSKVRVAAGPNPGQDAQDAIASLVAAGSAAALDTFFPTGGVKTAGNDWKAFLPYKVATLAYTDPDARTIDGSLEAPTWGEVLNRAKMWSTRGVNLIGLAVSGGFNASTMTAGEDYAQHPLYTGFQDFASAHPAGIRISATGQGITMSDLATGAGEVKALWSDFEQNGGSVHPGAMLDLIRLALDSGAVWLGTTRFLLTEVLKSVPTPDSDTFDVELLGAALSMQYSLVDILATGIDVPDLMRDGPGATLLRMKTAPAGLLINSAIELAPQLASQIHITGAAAVYGVPYTRASVSN